ncbi:unnamed protein product [Arabidopsis halleri]
MWLFVSRMFCLNLFGKRKMPCSFSVLLMVRGYHVGLNNLVPFRLQCRI